MMACTVEMLKLRFARLVVLPGTPAVCWCEGGESNVDGAPGKAPAATGIYTVMKEKDK